MIEKRKSDTFLGPVRGAHSKGPFSRGPQEGTASPVEGGADFEWDRSEGSPAADETAVKRGWLAPGVGVGGSGRTGGEVSPSPAALERRGGERGKLAPRPGVHQPRPMSVVFVRDPFQDGEEGQVVKRDWEAWGTGGRLPRPAARRWHRYHRRRDVALLMMLAQHGYLTTEDIWQLFWPEASAWHARRRLRWLRELRLATRWWQLLPTVDSWRRMSSVWMLTQPGAALAAQYLGVDPKPIIVRSSYVAEGMRPIDHDLAVNRFMVQLAQAAADIGDQGLYSWVGEPGMRRLVQLSQQLEEADEPRELAPDAWGRYLTAEGEVLFHLEHDTGTEKPADLGVKAHRYLRQARVGEQVLFTLPNAARERSVRSAIERAGAGSEVWRHRRVRCWTTTFQLLAEHGPLGRIWRGFGPDAEGFLALPELPGLARDPGLQVEHSIAKPRWWEHRPGAGEGM